MGSGGGSRSSGTTFSKPRPSKQPAGPPGRGSGGGGAGGGGGGSGGGGQDQCDLTFETDLAAVNSTAADKLSVGDELSVVLVDQQGFPTVVCRTSSGELVGSLANVEDLALLIGCIQGGNHYNAIVRDVGSTYCTVFVERS